MDLAEPATALVPGGTAAVLRALAGVTTGVGVRQLARIAGVSPNRASQVVRHLERHGLVEVEEQLGGASCRLNRDHLAARAVLDLVGLRGRLLDLLRDEASTWDPQPLHVSVFGSAARGDGSTSSDIDVLVVVASEPDAAWDDQLQGSGSRIRRASGNDVSWFVVTVDDVARGEGANEPVIDSWRHEGVHLTGDRLDSLLGAR